MINKILIISAHPDDEILGCGGTVARLIKEGCEAFTIILGEGITSRDDKRNRKKRVKEIDNLKNQIYKANKLLGVKEVFTFDFPDNRFDAVDFLDIVKSIEKIKNKLKPEIIFTHSKADLNIDHQITYKAVITATRPLYYESVKQIYSFEILSSTEWNYQVFFSPNVYFYISNTLDIKLKSMEAYKTEIKDYPHPRSLEGVKLNTEQKGLEVGFKCAEPFELIRRLVQ